VDPDAIAIAARALLLICVYQAAGTAFFVALFVRDCPPTSARICRLGAISALCGIALVLPQPALEAARMAGEFTGMRDPVLLRLALRSSHGTAHVLQLAGLLLVGTGLRFHRRGAERSAWTLPVALLGAAIATLALTLTGHTSVLPGRALLAPMLGLHLLVAAFWLGAFWPLWLTLRHETVTVAAGVLRRFSRLAGWLVPTIALAGLGMAFVMIDSWSVFERPYGRLLIAKAGVFALLMALAALNRWRLTPALLIGQPLARGALQRSIVAEYLLMASVLAMTATLTTLYSPED
jgi:putative copper export protein